jgi:hypothetical protein
MACLPFVFCIGKGDGEEIRKGVNPQCRNWNDGFKKALISSVNTPLTLHEIDTCSKRLKNFISKFYD